MTKLLSICIPTVDGREEQLNVLLFKIKSQIKDFQDDVEIIIEKDDKTMTIGAKRNVMHQKAAGLFTWTIDDDDSVNHISKVIGAIIEFGNDIDCIGFKELCIFNGKKVESSCFSLRYDDWADNVDGYNHVRTPFFKTPIKTSIVQSTLVEDIRFAEDHAFARAIKPKLNNEYFIDEFVYIYQHNDEGKGHEYRYGFYKDNK